MAGKRGNDASFSCGLTGKLGGASSNLDIARIIGGKHVH